MKGIPASGGLAIGKAYLYITQELEISEEKIEPNAVIEELALFDEAIKDTKIQLTQIKEDTAAVLSSQEAAVFDAHIMILEDPEFAGEIKDRIKNDYINAAAATNMVTTELVEQFKAIEDEYFKERAVDVYDVGQRILRNILGVEEADLSKIPNDSIIFAHDLSPSDTARLDKKKAIAFAMDVGGRTSHTAIMARSLQIPAVLGLVDATKTVNNGETVIVDGDVGQIIVNPDIMTIQKYAELREAQIRQKAELFEIKDEKAITADGYQVELVANIGSVENAKDALDFGAEGVGLFRTEFLYMNSPNMPSEDVQFEAYKSVLTNMGEKPVIIRTLDIGGDKKLDYLKMDEEMNPFLGVRAIRLCFEQEDMFKTQLKAILRASAFGQALIMFPMISGIEEVKKAKAILETCKNELKEIGVAFDEQIKVGVMIEIPSAAVMADVIAKEVDFFSIGTNDLCQYTLAVDRMNEKVSYLYDHYNPAVLRLIKMVIDASHKEGKFTGMCGEMASDEKAAMLLLGMGLDEFSMNAPSLLKVKKVIRSCSMEKAKELAEKALMAKDSKEVRVLIDQVNE